MEEHKEIVSVGLTGTKTGMTEFQKDGVRNILSYIKIILPETKLFYRHGDCVGADAEGHDISEDLGYQPIVHPPTKDKFRAFKHSKYILELYPYLVRDRHIVNNSNLMLATPNSRIPNPRSGTWYTYNYAEKQGVPRILIHIDGEILPEGKQQDWKDYITKNLL